MAQVKIIMHNMGGERSIVDTLYVKGYDNSQEIETVMTEVGMPPSGWENGYRYSADIDPDIDSKHAMTVDEFKQRITTP
jgi:hypothetical protein